MKIGCIIQHPQKNESFQIKSFLGLGQEGEVYEAIPKNQSYYKSNVAIKIIKEIKKAEIDFIDWLIDYQKQYEQIEKSFIVRIYEKFVSDYTYVVMELGQTSLKEYIKSNKNMDDFEKELICLQISYSIKFLHKNSYFHRDIKPRNYIKVGDEFKLIDFGLIKLTQPQYKQSLEHDIRLTIAVGTCQYSAPETKQDKYSSQIDIWSLGCLFYEIFQGQQLFQGKSYQQVQQQKNQLVLSIAVNKIHTMLNQMQQSKWSNLIISMLNPDPGLRPNIDQVIQSIGNQKVLRFSEAQPINQKSQSERFFLMKHNINNCQISEQGALLSSYNTSYTTLVNSLIDAPTKQFPNRKFHLTELLGDGGEGGVFQADPKNETYYKANQISIAIKVQSTISDAELNFIDFLIDFQGKAFQISNLIRVYERFKYKNYHFIIMELGGKDLLSCLQEKNKLTISQKEQIIYQLTLSISFLHSNAFIHRNIKPENFIQIGSNFKLIDFGLIKKGKENLRLTKKVGTPLYQAPEIINGSEVYSSSIDIWSLGCLFYEIFQESSLFNGDDLSQVQQQILNYCQDQQIIHNSINQLPIKQELKDLIKKMIDPNPFNRPTIENVKNSLLPKFQLNPNKWVHTQFQLIQKID